MNSQFTIYSYADNGAPQLTAAPGSLNAVLDACLVDGYGSKPSAGWLKTYATGSITASNSLTAYKQPSGSQCTLFVNDDNAVIITRVFAYAAGWTTFAGIPVTHSSANVGSGSGQFPLPQQLLSTGHVSLSKSSTVTLNVIKPWIMYADASTMYFFVQCANTTAYNCLWFGDIYSHKLTPDTYKCMIAGHIAHTNTSPTYSDESCEIIASYVAAPTYGTMYMNGSFERPGSIAVFKSGDMAKSGVASTNYASMCGVIPAPNPTDNSLYLSPLFVFEPNSFVIRGRMRGMYQVCHPITSFSDGQIIQGANDYAGKTFQIVKTGFTGVGFWAIETSNTLDTN